MTSLSDPETELRKLWTAKGVPAERQDELVSQIIATPAPVFYDAPFRDAVTRALERPVEDLTPEGIQLVIPGAERVAPPSQKQLDLF